jgi:hypothetical protein
MPQRADLRRGRRLAAIGQLGVRVIDAQHMAFHLDPAQIPQSLVGQGGAGLLHQKTRIERATLAVAHIQIAQDPRGARRPGQHPESGQIRHRQHVAGTAHRLLAEAAVLGEHRHADGVGRVHRQQRGGERHAVAHRLQKMSRLDRAHPRQAMRVDEADPDRGNLSVLDQPLRRRRRLVTLGRFQSDLFNEIRTPDHSPRQPA